ncbi:unnamed protein product [Durusdinium trenchii]|uniref:Uncharacterized protein n=2 Tax=Durusdinium trenchii TaxID=1381693 RepID=A0ABP0HEN6_9DINO
MAEETGAIFGIALVQPSLKPADLALENVRFQQPELQEIQIEEAEPDFGAQWTAEENFGYRNSYESWTRYTEDDPEAAPNRFAHEVWAKDVQHFMKLVHNNPTSFKQHVREKRRVEGVLWPWANGFASIWG